MKLTHLTLISIVVVNTAISASAQKGGADGVSELGGAWSAWGPPGYHTGDDTCTIYEWTGYNGNTSPIPSTAGGASCVSAAFYGTTSSSTTTFNDNGQGIFQGNITDDVACYNSWDTTMSTESNDFALPVPGSISNDVSRLTWCFTNTGTTQALFNIDDVYLEAGLGNQGPSNYKVNAFHEDQSGINFLGTTDTGNFDSSFSDNPATPQLGPFSVTHFVNGSTYNITGNIDAYTMAVDQSVVLQPGDKFYVQMYAWGGTGNVSDILAVADAAAGICIDCDYAPEPGSALLLILGALPIFARRRR